MAAIVLAASAAFTDAVADTRFPTGYWRGTNPMRGAGSGQWVSIVSMFITALPPRSPRDTEPGYTTALRLRIDGPGPPSLRRVPEPRIQHPRPDPRPGFVPQVRVVEVTSSVSRMIDDPKSGRIMQIEVRPNPLPDLPAAAQCGFGLVIAEHGGPAGADVYYQIIPQRSPCSGGPFDGMAPSRGFLVR